jgi:hypothetical protein
MKVKHTVYKTTNSLNNKYYIGVHSTKDVHDSYLGSGSVFKKALKKYGKENFIKEILFSFDSKEEAYQKEKELITESEIRDKKTYNIALGGQGGTLGMSQCHTPEARKKHQSYMKNFGQGYWLMTPEIRKKAGKSISEAKSILWHQYTIWGDFIKTHKGLKTASKTSGKSMTAIQKNLDKSNIWLKEKSDASALKEAEDRLSLSPLILLNKTTLKLEHYWFSTARLKNEVGMNFRSYKKYIKNKYTVVTRISKSSTTSLRAYTASEKQFSIKLENRFKAVEMDGTSSEVKI